MTTHALERRTWTGSVELRAAGDGAMPVAQGYAAKFGKRSAPLGGFVEVVAPTAFTKTLGEADVRALFNHEVSALLGRMGAGTLRMHIDNVGLAYAIDMPDTTLGRDVAELLKRGDIVGSSFGFRTIADTWSKLPDGSMLRSLDETALRDVGPVTFAAYPDASAALRSLSDTTGIEVRALVELAQANELVRAFDADSPKEIRRRRVVIA